MNNQNTSSQYGYVNRNGRLVPTNQSARERVIYYTKDDSKETSQPKTTKQKKTYAEKNVDRKTKKEKNVKKGIKRLCLYLSLFVIISSAKQYPFNIKGKVTEVAEKNREHSYMDEVFASDEKIEIVNPKNGKTQKIELEEAANKLEDYLEICSLINNLDIDDADYSELTEKEQKKAIELYNETGIEGVISLYEKNRNNNIEKARTARQLIFIRDYFGGEWIEKNGLNIAKALLTKTIQTGVIENYGTFNPLEYNVVEIPNENEQSLFMVKINDPVSSASDDVMITPITCGEYAQALLLSKKLNTVDEQLLTQEEKQMLIEHTLRVVKKCINKDIDNVYGITYTHKK